MKITGQLLRENRERKGISLSEVAVSTKINVRSLAAMESGDTENLPPKTFLRGFVKSYATFLELDVDSVMATFQEEMGSTRPQSIPSLTHPSPTPSAAPPTEASGKAVSSKKSSPRETQDAINPKSSIIVRISVVAAILAVVILIVFVKKKMESYEKETVVDQVPSEITSIDTSKTAAVHGNPPTGAESSSGPVKGDGDKPPEPPANATTLAAVAPTATPQPTPTATPSAKPTATPSPTPTAKPSPTATPTPTPTATPSTTPTPSPTPAAPAPSPAAPAAAAVKPSPTPKPGPPARAQDIIVEALDNVDVDAQIDDEPLKKFHLKGEQVQSIKARRRLVLKFTDGGAVNLIVNGVERGVPGDLGKPLRIELP